MREIRGEREGAGDRCWVRGARGPGGRFEVAVTEFGLFGVAFPGYGGGRFEEELRQRLARKPQAKAKPEDAEALAARVASYLENWGEEIALHCHAFPPRLDLRGSPFQLRVWTALLKIPPGEVISYGDLAEVAGSPRAARAVGSSMRKNPVPLFVPCHRVVASNGPGGFGPGLAVKERLLKLEGYGAAQHG